MTTILGKTLWHDSGFPKKEAAAARNPAFGSRPEVRHNLSVLVHGTNELGAKPAFWGQKEVKALGC